MDLYEICATLTIMNEELFQESIIFTTCFSLKIQWKIVIMPMISLLMQVIQLMKYLTES